MENDTSLHLPDLHISGFRGIKSLDVSRLGRVTLIAGKNGVGKTTLLDAIRVYASRGNFNLLLEILNASEEIIASNEEDRVAATPDFQALMHGRALSPEFPIVIGPRNVQKQLRIAAHPTPYQTGVVVDASPYIDDVLIGIDDILIKREFLGKEQEALYSDVIQPRSRARFRQEFQIPTIKCETLGPDVIGNSAMAKFWDRIALTDYEERAVQVLRLIYDDEIERLAFIGHETRASRRAVVKVRSQKRPIPLQSLGEGALRMFGVALALANSQDGLLLIDEAENGIHHSIQHAYWRMVLETAQKYNVQVLATTHSWDCVRGFAHAVEDSAIKGVFFRLQKRSDGSVFAMEYPDESLRIAAGDGIEVR